MFYFVYETKNLINGKIYIGVHSTYDINDNYLGSGFLLQKSIEKYGRENFKRTILQFFDNKEEMFLYEKEIVTNDFIKRNDTYNIKIGGNGGFQYVNENVLTSDLRSKGGKNAHLTLKLNRLGIYSENYKSVFANNSIQTALQKRANSLESLKKKKETYVKNKHQQGSKNSQFGTCWITNGQENKKIKKENLDLWLELGYYKGRV